MAHWIVWTLLTLVSWGIWAVLFRFIGDELSPAGAQIISTIGIIPVLGGLWWLKEVPQSGRHSWGVALALGSGILSGLGNVAYYEALNHAKAATVVPLTALYPIVTILLAIPVLKERVTTVQVVGIGLSLVAIYLFNTTQGSEKFQGFISGWTLLLPLAAIVLWGITALMQKMATNHLSARSSAIWFLVAFFPVAGLLLLYNPLPDEISAKTLLVALAMGFSLALGNFTVLLAFASGGRASIIAPLAGLYPLISIPIAIVAFDEQLGGHELLGIVLALAAVVLLSLQSQPDVPSASPVKTDGSP